MAGETPNTHQENISISPKTALYLYSGRAGRILSNLAIILSIISLGSVFSFLLTGITFLIILLLLITMIVAIICTAGAVLAMPNYFGIMKSLIDFTGTSGTFLNKTMGIIVKAWPIVTPIAILCAAVSIVFLCLDRTTKHTSRITFASIVLAVTIIALIALLISNVGGNA